VRECIFRVVVLLFAVYLVPVFPVCSWPQAVNQKFSTTVLPFSAVRLRSGRKTGEPIVKGFTFELAHNVYETGDIETKTEIFGQPLAGI